MRPNAAQLLEHEFLFDAESYRDEFIELMKQNQEIQEQGFSIK